MIFRKTALITAFAAILIALTAFVDAAAGQTLAATKETHGFGFGYGDVRYDNFSAELDARFASVTIITDLTDLNEMLQYDAIMVQIREWTAVLSSQESTNLSAYVATGRRVLMMGENNLWTGWNNSLLAVVGGSYSGREGDGVMTVLNPYSPLTDNVTSVDLPDGGLALGGLSLFNTNFATVWSGDGTENVVSMLDVNVFEDDRWNTLDGGQFATNVTQWLSTGPGAGPTIKTSGSCPGALIITISGATPHGVVALLFAGGTGSVAIPSGKPCAGTVLGLNATAMLILTTNADASGNAVINGNAPPGACGGFLQALDVATCTPTNVSGL